MCFILRHRWHRRDEAKKHSLIPKHRTINHQKKKKKSFSCFWYVCISHSAPPLTLQALPQAASWNILIESSTQKQFCLLTFDTVAPRLEMGLAETVWPSEATCNVRWGEIRKLDMADLFFVCLESKPEKAMINSVYITAVFCVYFQIRDSFHHRCPSGRYTCFILPDLILGVRP